MEEALVYLGKNNQNKIELLTFCKQRNIHITFLDDEDMNQDILSLFNKNKETAHCKQFPFDFILFKNNDREIITSFYQEVKNMIHFTHKAVLTEHNKDWKLSDLLVEIHEEHLFFNDWQLLHELLQEANDSNHDAYTLESYEPYKKAFIEGYMYTKQPTSKEAIKGIITTIQKTKTALIEK